MAHIKASKRFSLRLLVALVDELDRCSERFRARGLDMTCKPSLPRCKAVLAPPPGVASSRQEHGEQTRKLGSRKSGRSAPYCSVSRISVVRSSARWTERNRPGSELTRRLKAKPEQADRHHRHRSGRKCAKGTPQAVTGTSSSRSTWRPCRVQSRGIWVGEPLLARVHDLPAVTAIDE
jgi:hypothetical protein